MDTGAIIVTTPQTKPRARRRTASFVRRGIGIAVVCLFIILLVPSNGYLGAQRADLVVQQAIGGRGFQLGAWEVQAIGEKARDLVTRPGSHLTTQEQHDWVVTYFDAIGRIEELNAKIEHIFADPKQTNPAATAASLQAELNELRSEQAQRRPAVERILEGQIAATLEEAGLTTAGRVWPPVRFHFTESPDYLIVSPRDRITVERGVYLDPALSTPEMERIEGQVQKELDVSALVDGTGGFSSYPTMVVETPSLDWVLDTIAHEWTHTYLYFHPLGWHYGDGGGMRTINETVASIVGDEISQLALQRFYPERMPAAGWPHPLSMRSDWLGKEPAAPEFEFGSFMRKTRLEVDRLLSEGKIKEAEDFMEAQRQVLVKHGYTIRKLNQAYFAFHGSYAVGPSATDPIGGKLRLLRKQAGSLVEFLRTVARFDQPADLDTALQ
jgi:hypothetical protein